MTKRKKLQLAGSALLTVLALFCAKDEVGISGNEASRFAVIQAVAEQNTFAIENTEFRTVDKVKRDGHLYSDKPLPLPFLAALVFKIPHRLAGLSFATRYNLAVYTVNLIFGATVSVLLFLVMFRLLRPLRGSLEAKFLLALAMCLGSWIFSYSTIFNNHTPAALAVAFLLLTAREFRRRPTRRNALFPALAAAGAAAADLPTGAFCALAALAVVFFDSPRTARLKNLRGCIAVGAAAAAAMMLLNAAAYGTVLPLYIAGTSGTFTPGTGDKSHLFYGYECLFGGRGLFSYQPFLLLAIPMTALGWKKFRRGEKIVLAATGAVCAFYLLCTNEFGGWAYGFRYLIAVIPVLWFEASRLTLNTRSRAVKLLAAPLIAVGVVTGYIGAYSPFCPAYEGFRTPPGNITARVPNTFEFNLIAWGYENWPESRWIRLLRNRRDAKTDFELLYWSYFNLKRPDLLARLEAERRTPQPERTELKP